MLKSRSFWTAVLTIILGVALIIFKGAVASIALTVLGVVFIVLGVIDLIKKRSLLYAIIKIVIGIAVLVLGWVLVTIALYVLGGLLIVYGLYDLISAIKSKSKGFFVILKPILMVVVGVVLIINQGLAVDWLFIVVGAILIVEGVLYLFGSGKSKSKKSSKKRK